MVKDGAVTAEAYYPADDIFFPSILFTTPDTSISFGPLHSYKLLTCAESTGMFNGHRSVRFPLYCQMNAGLAEST